MLSVCIRCLFVQTIGRRLVGILKQRTKVLICPLRIVQTFLTLLILEDKNLKKYAIDFMEQLGTFDYIRQVVYNHKGVGTFELLHDL